MIEVGDRESLKKDCASLKSGNDIESWRRELKEPGGNEKVGMCHNCESARSLAKNGSEPNRPLSMSTTRNEGMKTIEDRSVGDKE